MEMNKTLVWEVMSALNRKESKELLQFLDASLFNTREDLRILAHVILKNIKQNDVEKEKIFSLAFPKQRYDDQKFRLLLSYLLKKVEDFIVIKEKLNNPLERTVVLMNYHRKKGLDKSFVKQMNASTKKLAIHTIKNTDFYYYDYQIQNQVYQYLSQNVRSKKVNLQQVENRLDVLTVNTKLKTACLAFSHQSVVKMPYRYCLMKSIVSLAETEPFSKIASIQVYKNHYLSLINPNEDKYFSEFKKLLFLHKDEFPAAEIRDLFLMAINYCIKKINANRREYMYEALDLYKKGLDELLIENGQISRFTYINIVVIGIGINDLEWIAGFIEKYRNYLDSHYREEAYNFCKANLAYAQGDYTKALNYLQHVEYEDIINNMIIRILKLKIFYELGEFDVLESHVKNMTAYIRRRKDIAYHSENWRNIIKYTKKLIAVNQHDKKQVETLKQAIQNEKILAIKEWMMDMLEKI